MKKPLLILMIVVASLFLFGYAHAQIVPAQNQIILSPYGGVIVATSSTATHKLSASTTLATYFGGTGTSVLPTLGQILLGNTNGTYSPVSTTSLGIRAGLSTSTPWTVSSLAYVVSDSAVSSVATTTLTGNSQIALSNPIVVIGGSPSVLSIVADSIGDTQLAFNTGQNLTTASSPTFAGLTIGTLTGPLQAISGVVSASSTLSVGYGGTSSTTLTGILKGNGTGPIQTAISGTDYEAALTFSDGLNRSVNAVNCVTATGSVKGCLSSTDWTTFNSKVSTTRALTIAGTANQITSSAGAQDLSADRTWTLSLPSHVIFPSSYQAALGSTTNATSSNLTVTGNAIISGLTSALLLTDANGLLAEYAGAGCTSQVVEDISALGASNCVSINNGYWSGTDLAVTNGGTGLSTFGGTNTLLYTTAADTLSSEAALTYNPTTNLLTVDNASTTNFSAATWLGIPNNTNPAVAVAGTLAINTTAASSSLAFYDGTAERQLFAETDFAFNYPTTTAAAGTTTKLISGPIRSTTYTQIGCLSRGGTAVVQIGNGTASSTSVISATGNTTTYTTLSSNNVFDKGVARFIAIGTFSATSVTEVTCTIGRRYDAS